MRPTREQLLACAGRTIPDVVAPDLDVVFCGINPGLYTAFTGWHFARPGNRFWPALHRSGFTPRQLHPSEQHELPALGLGITNVVPRATAAADELTADEYAAGGVQLDRKVAKLRPRFLSVLGVTAYRAAFGARTAVVGRQRDLLHGAVVWVLPNPSGLNAHYPLPRLAELFGELRAAARRESHSPVS